MHLALLIRIKFIYENYYMHAKYHSNASFFFREIGMCKLKYTFIAYKICLYEVIIKEK